MSGTRIPFSICERVEMVEDSQVVWIVDGRLRKVGTYKELSDDDEFMELVGSQVVAEDVASDEEAQDEDAVIEDGAAAPPKSEGHMITKQVEKKGLTGTSADSCPHCMLVSSPREQNESNPL